jgi:DNA gyrase/topoisomerase IV subunit A
MATKAKTQANTTPEASTTITASQYLDDTSREYSIYVCSNRAIPNVTDGLKDSQRKALWTVRNKNEKIKTISLAGEMISSGLYLAGDTSASGAASMLAAPFVNNVPLIEGIGAFGTRVSPVEGIGAPRYTYLKKSKVTESLVYPDLDIVPLVDNYDGSTKQPETFLPIIPMVLLNGVQGIAVGWATNILPRNLKKLVIATQAAIDGKPIRGLEPSYDYLNCAVSFLEGNSWEFYGKVEIVNTTTVRITELPPGLSLDSFRKRLIKMEEEDKIVTFVDNSTKVIDIVVNFRRADIKGWVEEDFIQYFKLRQKETENIVVLDWTGKSIKQYQDTEQLVKDFVEWRLGWYVKRYQKFVADDEYELKYWQGVKACFDNKLPERFTKKKDKADLELDVDTITKAIGLDGHQIDKIVSLPAYRWVAEYLTVVKDNIVRLQNQIKENKAILKSKDRIKEIYKAELEALKKIA